MTCTKVKLNGKNYNAARPIPSHVGMSKRSWIVELDAFALIASKTACHSQRYKVKDSGARRKIWKNKICIQYVYVYIYIHVEKDPKTECPWLSRNSDFQSPQRLYSLVALTTSPCNNCLVVWPEQLQTWQPSWAILWMRHPEIDDNTCFKEWTPA